MRIAVVLLGFITSVLLVSSCDLIKSYTTGGSNSGGQTVSTSPSPAGSAPEKMERFSLMGRFPLLCPDEIRQITGKRWDWVNWERAEYDKAWNQLADLSYKLEEQLEKQPDDAEAEYKLGTIWGMLGDWPKAMEHLEASITVDQTNAPAIFNLGVAYWCYENYSDAELIFESLPDEFPEYTNYAPRYYYLIASHSSCGRYKDAIKAGETYVKLTKGDPYGKYEVFLTHEAIEAMEAGFAPLAATE